MLAHAAEQYSHPEFDSAPPLLPSQFYEEGAARMGEQAEHARHNFAYAQGGELAAILNNRATQIIEDRNTNPSAYDSTAERINRRAISPVTGKEEEASHWLSTSLKKARRFLDTDPLTYDSGDNEQRDPPGLIADLPLNSPLTGAVLEELRQTLWVDEDVDVGNRTYPTALLGIYLHLEDVYDQKGHPVSRQVILQRSRRLPRHEEYLAKFKDLYPHPEAPQRKATYSYIPHGQTPAENQPDVGNPRYTPTASFRYRQKGLADTDSLQVIPGGTESSKYDNYRPTMPSTGLKPGKHTPSHASYADTDHLPVAPTGVHENQEPVSNDLASNVERVRRWAGDSVELDVLQVRARHLESSLGRSFADSADQTMQRVIRENTERAVRATAAFFAASHLEEHSSRSVQLYSIPSSHNFDPTTQLDPASEATKFELEKLFDVAPGADNMKQRRHYNHGEDRLVFFRASEAFPGFNLAYHYVRNRHGTFSKFEIILERSKGE